MAKILVYCMCSGYFHEDQSAFTHSQGMGRVVRVPTLFFLIAHPKGLALFETGFDRMVASDPNAYFGPMAQARGVEMVCGQSAVEQLQTLGYSPNDVDFVIVSCLYFDHAGGLKYFPRAQVVVQSDELREAYWPTMGRLAIVGEDAYLKQDLDRVRSFRFLFPGAYDLDLFHDGSVMVLRAPCHARGEQALLVRLENTGSVLLPAGVIPQRKNYEEDIITGRLMVSPDEAMRNVLRLKRMAEDERATVLFHHDLEAWQTCRQAPAFYD